MQLIFRLFEPKCKEVKVEEHISNHAAAQMFFVESVSWELHSPVSLKSRVCKNFLSSNKT